MKPRIELTEQEVETLYGSIDRTLDGIGIETQPEVAARILDLSADPDSGLAQYAEVIRTDTILSGRLLRLVNSAFFAQRAPVTTVDRACVLLGMGRLRSVALGFYLSRAAACDPSRQVSREVWGQSVFRACLAAELARRVCPILAPEAFVAGLMLDVGIPLMHRLLGEPFDAIYNRRLAPAKQFRIETELLPFTHVDVAKVLARRWRLPEILTKAIEWHHAQPDETTINTACGRLHPVAFFAGAVDLTPDAALKQESPMPTLAASVLGLSQVDIGQIARTSVREYHAVLALFDGVADAVQNIDSLAERVHAELLEVIDTESGREFDREMRTRAVRFILGGGPVEIEADESDTAVIYLLDSAGERLASYRFTATRETPASLCTSLGLELAQSDQQEEITRFLRDLAA